MTMKGGEPPKPEYGKDEMNKVAELSLELYKVRPPRFKAVVHTETRDVVSVLDDSFVEIKGALDGFVDVRGELKEQLVILPRNGRALLPLGVVLIEAGGIHGLNAREALSYIGNRQATISTYPRDREVAIARRTSLFGPPSSRERPLPSKVTSGESVGWEKDQVPFPNYKGAWVGDWWPQDYAKSSAWREMALVAINEDQRRHGVRHLGLLVVTWCVCELETHCGEAWSKKGLNLGNTVAIPLDGTAFFKAEDSSPQVGKYIAHFTSFDKLYSDPGTAWTASANRVRSTLERDHVPEVFKDSNSLPTDSELGLVARVMYEHGYYAGTHTLMSNGHPVMRGGRPIPDGEANILAYWDLLKTINSKNSKMIRQILSI